MPELAPVTEEIAKLYPRLKPGLLNIASMSDLHFGHSRTPSSYLSRNLMSAFPDNAETAALDIIIIAGDFFDDLLMLNDPDTIVADMFITYLLRICKKYNILLFVLEGTSSHDWKQSKRFVTINEIAEINAPLYYIDKLCIEYFPQFDIQVLFVPDDLPGGPEKTLQDARDMMRVKGLEQVDFAVMHGQFKFQLPSHVNAPKHDEDAYLAMVKELILIGHDHTHKQLDRIYVHGSFDRLGHGYESPKGHIRAYKRGSQDWDVVFVENKNAMIYLTVDCQGLDIDATLTKIRKVVKDIPDDSYVRVRADADNPIFTSMNTLILEFPLIGWTKDPKQNKEEETISLAEADDLYVPIAITRDNLAPLLLERLATRGASGAVMDKAQDLLEELSLWPTN